jgi:phosphoserine phosphatase
MGRDMNALSSRVRGVLSHIVRTGRKGPATFDGDGTLWSGDVGQGFFKWMLTNRHYPAQRIPMLERAWRSYRAGKYDGEKFYELMVTAMAGMKETKVKELAREYFDQHHRSRVYRPMVKLVESLKGIDVSPWVVSGSPYWVVAAGARHLNIPEDRVIGLSVRVDKGGYLTDEVVRPVPWKIGKAKRIMQQVGAAPVLAAGNSYGDIQMLRIASEFPLVINPGPQVLRQAKTYGWTIHRYTRNDHMTWQD